MSHHRAQARGDLGNGRDAERGAGRHLNVRGAGVAVLALILALGLLVAPAAGRPAGPPIGGPPSEAPPAHDGPAASAAAGGARLAAPPPSEGYEIWLPDQGTNTMHIYDPALEEIDVIPLGEGTGPGNEDIIRPHMIDFDSQGRYAFVANTVSGNVAVIHTESREVVAVLDDLGPGTHMAAVTPDDEALWVAVIGGPDLEGRFLEFELDDLETDDPTITPGASIDLTQALLEGDHGFDYRSAGAVCHEYTADSRFAYLTLGPGAGDGGLVVVDLDTAELVEFFDPDVVKANCGLALSADGTKMYANWSGVVGQEADEDTGQDAVPAVDGEWYVFDTGTHELVHTDSSRGVDAHGVRGTPDGRLLWMVNRATSNAIVIDQRTDRVLRELPFVGQSPDILDFSPDGRYAYVSLRGPEPLSGPHAIAGDTPGIAVLHVPSGRLLTIVEQPPKHDEDGALLNDPHGIGVRVIHD